TSHLASRRWKRWPAGGRSSARPSVGSPSPSRIASPASLFRRATRPRSPSGCASFWMIPPGGTGWAAPPVPAWSAASPGRRWRRVRQISIVSCSRKEQILWRPCGVRRSEGSAMALIDVLIPTYRRKTGLAVVLTSLLGQTFTGFDVIVSDQTELEDTYLDSIEIQTLVRALEWHGHRVTLHRHLPRRGMAEQRQF